MTTEAEYLAILLNAKNKYPNGMSSTATAGLPDPQASALQEIVRDRKREALEKISSQLHEDLHRRCAEYRTVVQHVDPALGGFSGFSDAPPMADIECSRVVLAPLKTLFRVLIVRMRVERHLKAFHEKQSSRSDSLESSAKIKSKIAAVPSIVVVGTTSADLDHSAGNEDTTVVNLNPHTDLSSFYNWTTFQQKELREFFVYKRNNYVPEKFPEYVLRVDEQVRKEVEPYYAFVAPDSGGTSTASEQLSFTQPMPTMETYPSRSNARTLRPLSGFYDKAGEFSELKTSDAHDGTHDVVSAASMKCVSLSSLQTSASLLRVPRRYQKGCPDDAISGSDTDEESPNFYQPGTSWLPPTYMTVSNMRQKDNIPTNGLASFTARYF